MKSPTQNNELTQAESELYDRQIRLWGVESQKRLRLSRVLIIGVQGYGCEIAKNIILSGVHSVTLLDSGVVTDEDACAQFLAPRDQIGQNRAEASLARAQQLNPMVQVAADKDNIDDKPDSFFEDFHVICATRCSTEQLIRIDKICRKKKVLFFCGDIYGTFGYMFADLGEHNFEKTITSYPISASGDVKKGEDKITKTVADKSLYISLAEALEDERAQEVYAKQKAKMDPSYLVLKVLLRFRSEHGRDPLPSRRAEDIATLLTLRDVTLTSLAVPTTSLPDDILANVFAEWSPVCAILGGVMGQEVIKAVSGKEEPHKNFFFYNPVKCLGFVENVTVKASKLPSSVVKITLKMASEMEQVEKLFTFKFPTCTTNQEYKLEVPIRVPFSGSVEELTQRLITSFKLPCFVERDLLPALTAFIKEQSITYFDDVGERAIADAMSGAVDVDEVIRAWERSFKKETVEYAEPRGSSDEELFSTVYHKLVHSPALETILQVEHSYALAVSDIAAQRDEQISALTTKQTDEMVHAVEGVGEYSDEHYVNQLAVRHFEDQNLVQGKWNSEVDALKQSQRHEYREWLMKMLEDQQTSSTLTTPTSSPMMPNAPRSIKSANSQEESSQLPRLEESFTIHLGSQMKQMHNIRILSGDVLDFCQVKPQEAGSLDPQPQRLQTALALYSNDLCGLVLLTDNHIGSYSSLTKDLSTICQSSTEFHFPPMDDQLEHVRDEVKKAVAWRQGHHLSHSDHLLTLTSSEQQSRRAGTTKHLQTGDVYITRHSNLADMHIVFHMVVDDSLRSNDINSRHAVILGLRNILKTACSNDITTLTIPILLMHEMTEEMTVAWCTKRAELVFKCVKGFMIEMASWGGSELKNLQFLVPKGMSEDVFSTLATMLPSIFRVSNPLVFKASSTPQTPKMSNHN